MPRGCILTLETATVDVLNPGIAFLHKPFTSETLGRKIREVLDPVDLRLTAAAPDHNTSP